MTKRFVEGNLLFKFDDDRWKPLFRWDKHAEYRNGMKDATWRGKAVDFVGVLDRKVPFLIEVKDFRDHARNEDKMSIEHEFELKVRSTVAALFGLHRRKPRSECAEAFEALRSKEQVRLVLWQEGALERPRHHRSTPSGGDFAGTLSDRLKRTMRWLDADTIVMSSSSNYRRFGLEVDNLPPSRKQKAEEVVAILKERALEVPPDIGDRIEGIEREDELDALIERARTVRVAWKLFSDRR